ncbi:MAG: amidohydrolase [Candidatus Micrarchaeia archaeon]
MTIRIRGVLVGNKRTDILVEGNRIAKIGDCRGVRAEFEIDGAKKAAIPGLSNCHTHAAMTLFRGYADDLPLQDWLEKKIWPLEGKLTKDDIYWGTKLACLEMVKTGTTFFSDMYWNVPSVAKAVGESGMRATLSAAFTDAAGKSKREKNIMLNERLYKQIHNTAGGRIRMALGPHAPYTASEEALLWCKEFADRHGLLIHIHVSENRREVEESVKKTGLRPVEYLEKIGFLESNVVACHCAWVNDGEISILAKRKVTVVHNPASNLKLASAISFPYAKLKKAGVRVLLGTDGAASNNSLDMFGAMKLASLLQKGVDANPGAFPAADVFAAATSRPATAFGIDAGEIREGKLADLLLVDLRRPEMVPNHNLISNLVYSANGSCVDTTICDGKILMQDGLVEGEEKIMEKAEGAAFAAVRR